MRPIPAQRAGLPAHGNTTTFEFKSEGGIHSLFTERCFLLTLVRYVSIFVEQKESAMPRNSTPAYMGRILRVNLTRREASEEEFRLPDRIKWIGGTGFSAKILSEEVFRL